LPEEEVSAVLPFGYIETDNIIIVTIAKNININKCYITERELLHMAKENKSEKNKESVWDYPQKPRVEDSPQHIEIYFHGEKIANSKRTKRVLERGIAPIYYIPPEDIMMEYFHKTDRTSTCPYKGDAAYYTIIVDSNKSENAAWSYPEPKSGYEDIRAYLAFYPHRVSECYVDGEKINPQPEKSYGWITNNIEGLSKRK